jgi:methyltransferase (TIGR00027 family)
LSRIVTAASSNTARTAAAARAAHLIVDQPPTIFADTLALDLLGEEAEEFVGYHRLHGSHLVLAAARGQVVCRSRFAEDRLTAAVRRGVRQYVILGAGLDSFAYRSALSPQVRVFEVDQRATSDWKRRRLAAAGIAEPANLVFVACDLGAGSFADDLVRTGLGVTMYLTGGAIGRTLADLSALAPGSEIVADYMLPRALRDEAGNTYVDLVAPNAAERGEPWLTFLSPEEMSKLLNAHGFRPLRHVAQCDIGGPATWMRSDSLRPVDLALIAHAALRAGDVTAERATGS